MIAMVMFFFGVEVQAVTLLVETLSCG